MIDYSKWAWQVVDIVGVKNEDGEIPTEASLRYAAEFNEYTRFNEETKSLEVFVYPEA